MALPRPACERRGGADRPRYTALLKRIRAAVQERHELSDGCNYRLESDTVSLPEVAEWISLEGLCCPFLRFAPEVSGETPDWRLHLRGPAGVKAVLDAELSFGRRSGNA